MKLPLRRLEAFCAVTAVAPPGEWQLMWIPMKDGSKVSIDMAGLLNELLDALRALERESFKQPKGEA